MYKVYAIWFCICCLNICIQAEPQAAYQQEQIRKESFDHSQWENLRRKVKVNEENAPKQETEKPAAGKKNKTSTWEFHPYFKLIIKYALFAILIGILLFLVMYTLGINPFRKKKKAQLIPIDIESLAEHLDEAELDPYLIEAIKSGNYKLAIRLYYLQIVQRLNLAGKIRWKRYKTNKNYVNEMRAQHDYALFKEITLKYEKCWFGPGLITRQAYDEISPEFINYAKNLPVIE